MNYCTMCGSSIPKPQKVCSMCYGDIDYGRDGYYREYYEETGSEESLLKLGDALAKHDGGGE